MKAASDLTGQQFGRLTVVGPSHRNTRRQIHWRCSCTCGTETTARADHLTAGMKRSCGCLFLETMTTHGAARGYTCTREYNSWATAKQRCFNPKNPNYPRYGGRGISMCDAWKDSFEMFLRDMGPRPVGMSLDRYPNNDGDYEPGNCRWATNDQQTTNKRPKKTPTASSRYRWVEFNGERLHISEWARRLGVHNATLTYRVRHWPLERALTTTHQ